MAAPKDQMNLVSQEKVFMKAAKASQQVAERFREMQRAQNVASMSGVRAYLEQQEFIKKQIQGAIAYSRANAIAELATRDISAYSKIREIIKSQNAQMQAVINAFKFNHVEEIQKILAVKAINEVGLSKFKEYVANSTDSWGVVNDELLLNDVPISSAELEVAATAIESGDLLDSDDPTCSDAWWALSPRVRSFIATIVVSYIISIIANIHTPMWMNLFGINEADGSISTKKDISNDALELFEIGQLREYRFVYTESLIVRAGPGKKHDEIFAVKRGAIVRPIVRIGGWTKIEYETGDGEIISGWVYSRYLEKFKE